MVIATRKINFKLLKFQPPRSRGSRGRERGEEESDLIVSASGPDSPPFFLLSYLPLTY